MGAASKVNTANVQSKAFSAASKTQKAAKED
jgi:hypothetical protein